MSPFRSRREELLSNSPAERSIFLAKPVCPSALVSVLRAALDSSASDQLAVAGDVPWTRPILLAGKRVLVVEDDPVNQQVVGGLLESLGIDVTRVGGGRAAIETVATSSFDLVLMDVQMPDMDGLETTRRLREEPPGDDLPIIALTAHAMKGDRDRCLAAGMNDHLTKPIDPERLAEVLCAWLGAERPQMGAPSTAIPAAGAGDETGTPADGAGVIDVEEGVRRVGGVRTTYMRLVRQFVSDHGGVAVALRRCVADGDIDRLRRLTHTLQGVAANLGAHQLAGISRALGKAAGTATEWEVQRILVQLESALAAVIDIVSTMEDVGRGSDRTVAGADDTSMDQSLARLAVMLREGNAESLDRLCSLRREVNREDLDRILESAEGSVRAYDYEQALQSLIDASNLLDVDLERGSTG